MTRKICYRIALLSCLITISWMIPFQEEENKDRPDRIKIVLREVGNQLLLSNRDSTSIILPVVQVTQDKYQLSFEKELTFLPDSLVAILDKNFEKAGLSKNYIVEVLRCEDQQVSYSYEMNMHWDKTIVPCSGRQVPEACHTIEVAFVKEPATLSSRNIVVVLLVAGTIGFLVFRFRESLKKEKTVSSTSTADNYATIGSYRFYPDQNKLVKEAYELPLSRKECELLALFVARPNEIIKREDLTKSVWEDNGVIVGRSLDTYISKLRKKFKEDSAIKIVNIHGVGYKLQIE